MELEETKIGRLDHKIEKLQILELVPGVEYLHDRASSGSNGLCIEEFAPFGVIGIVTPVTHSIPTLSANAINMIASGNSLVANAASERRELRRPCRSRIQQADRREIWHRRPDHLCACRRRWKRPSDFQSSRHRAAGGHRRPGGCPRGPGGARSERSSPGRAIRRSSSMKPPACKTPPTSIVKGAAYDNNLLCIGEKQVFCVESVFDKLMAQMEMAGGYILNRSQIDALTKAAFNIDAKDGKPHVNKDFVGRDASVLAAGGRRARSAGDATARRRNRCRSSVRPGRADDAVRAVRSREKCG